jgi:hypothetical protein
MDKRTFAKLLVKFLRDFCLAAEMYSSPENLADRDELQNMLDLEAAYTRLEEVVLTRYAVSFGVDNLIAEHLNNSEQHHQLITQAAAEEGFIV